MEIEEQTQEELMYDGYIAGNGRRFPFVELTVTQSAKIIGGIQLGIVESALWTSFPKKNKKRFWKKVRKIAFGYHRFSIVPKELRCSNIKQEIAEKIEADFFVYAQEIVKDVTTVLRSWIASPTANKKTNSETQ